MNLSNITSLFTGGMSTLYKWLAIVGVVLAMNIGSYFYGHHVGVQSQQVAQEKTVIKKQEKVITIIKTQMVVDTTAVEAMQKQLDQEKAKTLLLKNRLSNLTNQQLQVIKQTNGQTECVLSKDWVDAYNESIRGVSP